MAPKTTSLRISPTEKIGLSRLEAAGLIGVTPSMWDTFVAQGDMPPARRLGALERWDRREVEAAFSLMPTIERAKKSSPYADVA